MASPEPPPPTEATERRPIVSPEALVKDLLKRLSAESEELAEKAGIPEPTTPPATGAGVKIEKAHGIEARAVAGLRDAIQSSKALEDLVEVVRDVKSLDLQKGSIGDEGVASLSTAFRDANISSLLHLDLSDNGFTEKGFHELTQTIASGFLSGLESLNLSKNHIREEGSGMLGRILDIGRLPSLLRLNLSHCYIADYGVKIIATAMQSGHFSSWGLQYLDLSTNGFGEEGAVALSDALSMGRVPYLKHLDLSFNMIGEKGTLALAKALTSGQLSSLTDLVLARCYLGYGVEPIFKAMETGKLSHLQILDLSSNYMGERGCTAMLKALRSGKLSKLQTLVIAECGIDPQGLQLIPEAIEVGHVSGLRHLDMSNNFVNSATLRDVAYAGRYMESYTHVRRDFGSLALARLMKSGHLAGLRYLNLSRMTMTDDGLIALAEEMEAGHLPNLERFLLTDNDIGSGSSMKALVRALVSGNLPELRVLDLGHNVLGDDLTMALASVLEDTHSEAVDSPLVRTLKETRRMAKSPMENILHKLLIFLETQLGVSLRQRPNTPNMWNRLWQRQSTSRYVPVNDDEEGVGSSASNDNKLLFNALLVFVWIVAVWMSKW